MRNIRIERNGQKLTNEDLNAILRMAKSADVNAQYSLGLVYYYGQGPKVDFKEAGKWLKMAAEKGHSEAQYVLGEIHLAEDSAEDIEGAIYWLELASKDADLKCAKELLLKQAYLKYVIIYLMGCTIPNEKTGITEDMHDLAIEIRVYLMLRDYGSSIKAMKLLDGKTKDRILNEYVKRSLIYLNEIKNFIGSKEDSGTIQPWGNILVNKETGEIIAKSKEKLFVNKDKAGIVVDASDIRSEKKNPTTISDDELSSDSEENYRKGLESLTKKDYVNAGKYLFLAAKNGHPRSLYVYGKMLLYGTGVKRNIAEGIRLLQISSHKGYAKAATTLGEVYEKGILVQRDIKKAEELYRKAAELGDEKALQRINNSRK
jgi:hypothetical protein